MQQVRGRLRSGTGVLRLTKMFLVPLHDTLTNTFTNTIKNAKPHAFFPPESIECQDLANTEADVGYLNSLILSLLSLFCFTSIPDTRERAWQSKLLSHRT